MSGSATAASATKIIPFHGSEQALKSTSENFQVVAKNVQGLAIDTLLSQARVIFLGSRRLLESDQINTINVIHGFDPEQVRVLLVGRATELLSKLNLPARIIPKPIVYFPFNDIYQGIPTSILPYWKGEKLMPSDVDFYPNMIIQSIALEVFRDELVTLTPLLKTRRAHVKLELLNSNFAISLHLFPVMRIKQEVTQFTFYKIDKYNYRTPIELPYNMSKRLLTFLLEGKKTLSFTCYQFVEYLNGNYFGDHVLLFKIYTWHIWEPERIQLGETVILLDELSKPLHAATYIGDGLYLWLHGKLSLHISTIEEMKNYYNTTKTIRTLRKIHPSTTQPQACRLLEPTANFSDSHGEIARTIKLFNVSFLPLVKEGSHLLTLFSTAARGGKLDHEAREFFRKTALQWIKNYEISIKRQLEILRTAFIERDSQLTKMVKEEAESHEKKIFVIYDGEAANTLHDTMMESNIPFVILNQTASSQGKGFDLNNLLATSKKISLSYEGNIYPLSFIDHLTCQLDGKYQTDKPLFTAPMEWDIARLVLPILSLTLMKTEGLLSEIDLYE